MKLFDPRVGLALSIFSVVFSTVALILAIWSMMSGA